MLHTVKKCHNNLRDSIKRFASQVGTTYPTLKRWLIADFTLEQARSLSVFDPDKAYSKRYFGKFYTLLGSQEVQRFLGLEADVVSKRPVSSDRTEQLGQFISWVIGTEEEPPVINSRLQKQLDAILCSPRALQFFNSTRDPKTALLYTEFNSTAVAEKLRSASYTIESSLPKLYDVRQEDEVREAFDELQNAFRKAQLNIEGHGSE